MMRHIIVVVSGEKVVERIALWKFDWYDFSVSIENVLFFVAFDLPDVKTRTGAMQFAESRLRY